MKKKTLFSLLALVLSDELRNPFLNSKSKENEEYYIPEGKF